jgi:hypothetical protein
VRCPREETHPFFLFASPPRFLPFFGRGRGSVAGLLFWLARKLEVSQRPGQQTASPKTLFAGKKYRNYPWTCVRIFRSPFYDLSNLGRLIKPTPFFANEAHPRAHAQTPPFLLIPFSVGPFVDKILFALPISFSTFSKAF